MARLFMSKKGREKAERKERRQAFRRAEGAVENVKDRVREMQREADKQWTEARNALKSGEKAKAQRLLVGYRAAQVLATKLEQKRWVFEQYLAKMEAAQSDSEFAKALEGVNRITEVDPEQVADVFEASQDILGEQLDADRFWNKLFEKEMSGAEGALEDYIPSVDELARELEAEAGAEVGEGGAREAADEQLEQRIGAGRERVKKILDEK